uniref:type I restriction endonuclease n=1 Tax=Chryseobacterium indologenes TaxID=253 RepID=UPI000A489B82
MAFNEDSRVKIPAILHLMKLGYKYLPIAGNEKREDTNIFENIFIESISKINEGLSKDEIIRLLDEITLELDYEDLGEAFYERITATSGIKIIDFKNFEKNDFHIVTELTYKNGDEE